MPLFKFPTWNYMIFSQGRKNNDMIGKDFLREVFYERI